MPFKACQFSTKSKWGLIHTGDGEVHKCPHCLLETELPHFCIYIQPIGRAANILFERRSEICLSNWLLTRAGLTHLAQTNINHVESLCAISSRLMFVLYARSALFCSSHTPEGNIWLPLITASSLTLSDYCLLPSEIQRAGKKQKNEDENHEVEQNIFKKLDAVCSFRLCLSLGRQSVVKGSSRN